MTSSKPGLHHVSYACRDVDATHRFYEELMGFHLVHTEVVEKDGGFFRHAFYDTGDGPVWANHIAFAATAERQAEVKARMTAAGIAPLMEVDHGWCHSLYYLDPNGIMVEFCRDTPGIQADHELAKSLLHATSAHAPEKVRR